MMSAVAISRKYAPDGTLLISRYRGTWPQVKRIWRLERLTGELCPVTEPYREEGEPG